MNRHHIMAFFAVFLLAGVAGAEEKKERKEERKAERKFGYQDTPLQPNGKWHVHDGTRPQPRIVTSGRRPGDAPSDAIVLLGSKQDIGQWQHEDGAAVTWKWKAGALYSGKGYIQTRETFKDIQLHVEWATPRKIKGHGQGRGNSGVFMIHDFEVQVLDSFNNKTYPDGQASALYGQYPPLVNASRFPGQWQVYDILFRAPRFEDGKLTEKAVVTVIHNGVVTHHATQLWGPTTHKKNPPYDPNKHAEGPIRLQDHGNPVRYRNIWVRRLTDYDQP